MHHNSEIENEHNEQSEYKIKGNADLDTPNFKYLLTAPEVKFVQAEIKFRVGIIADLDHLSLDDKGTWMSYLKEGDLVLQYDKNDITRSNVKKCYLL